MFFALWDDNEDRGFKRWAFELPGIAAYEDTIEDALDTMYDELVQDLEEQYGVHDISGFDDAEGYGSYEIEEKDFPVLIELYRQWFVKRGFKVGEATVDRLDPSGQVISSAPLSQPGNSPSLDI